MPSWKIALKYPLLRSLRISKLAMVHDISYISDTFAKMIHYSSKIEEMRERFVGIFLKCLWNEIFFPENYGKMWEYKSLRRKTG